MKKLFIIFTIIFYTLSFSSDSYAEWTFVNNNEKGDRYYVDYGSVKYEDRNVYYWVLSDYLKKGKGGVLSVKAYRKANCDSIAVKGLTWIFYDGKMGEGSIIARVDDADKNWRYRGPASSGYDIITKICKNY